jgi:cell division protein FtsB
MKRKRWMFWGTVIIFFGTIFVKQQIAMIKLDREYRHYSDQLAKLQTISAQLSEELKQTQREDYTERLAREKLGLIKPGEILFKDKSKTK